MNKTLLSFVTLLSLLLPLNLAGKNSQRVYQVIVHENADSVLTLATTDGMQRGIIGDAWKSIRQSYASTLTGQLASVSSDILSSGIGLLVESLRSHRPDWLAQVKKDCSFTKQMFMPVEIANFYATTSNKGSTDPQGILFDGFGCQQYIEMVDTVDGRIEKNKIPVFDVHCSLRTDDAGISRMLHHGKFEVVLDYVFVNPQFCDLPNDSLDDKTIHLQTPFGFDKRQNLNFNIRAVITSSWMNQATQIFNDQQLGEFTIQFCIPDSSALEKSGPFKDCFVYVRPDSAYMASLGWDYELDAPKMKAKRASVSGECFLVPRSFIGTEDGVNYSRTWGTGQYKVNMTLSETCDVRMSYYCDRCHEQEMKDRTEKNKQMEGKVAKMPTNDERNLDKVAGMKGPGQQGVYQGKNKHDGDHKWNKRWGEEWKKMKQRRKNKSFFANIWDNVKMNFQDNKWVYTILEPVANAILEQENKFVSQKMNQWLKLGDAMAAGSTVKISNTNQGGGSLGSGNSNGNPFGEGKAGGNSGDPMGGNGQKPATPPAH